MKKLLFIILIFAAVLTACTTVLSGTPVEPAPSDPCEACSNLQECVEESCVCKQGFKICNAVCIAETACCGDEDCGESERCTNNQCTFSCDLTVCSANKVCDESLERCVCAEGYDFCDSQDKCIPEDHCCNRFDCGIDERCLPTITSTELCVTSGVLKMCKVIDERIGKEITLKDKVYDVEVSNFFYLQRIDLIVNNQSYVLSPGKSIILDGDTTLVAQKMREKGGRCLDFDFKVDNQ